MPNLSITHETKNYTVVVDIDRETLGMQLYCRGTGDDQKKKHRI